jgi:hypothetical protein
MLTEFHQYGLARSQVAVRGRHWLLTIDFEAFAPESIAVWAAAMEEWARCASRHDLRFCFFISVEDLVRLRLSDRSMFRRFSEAARSLHTTGSEFHPHNHCLFTPDSGDRPGASSGFPELVPGYAKRASMVYDVVYRNNVPLREWIPVLVESFDDVLADMGVARSPELAFRAGGWDYGATREDVTAYVDALADSGFAYDSTLSSGSFGTPSWKVGAPFPENVVLLKGLVETAPTDFVNCGARASILRWGAEALRARSLSLPPRSGGVLVTVIHFDHLFHTGRGTALQPFSVSDASTVRSRIERFFNALRLMRTSLGLRNCTFRDLPDAL